MRLTTQVQKNYERYSTLKNNIKRDFKSYISLERNNDKISSVCILFLYIQFYGSLIYSVLLPGDKYTNFVLGALASFSGDLLAFFAFQKFGRKLSMQFGFVFSAAFLVAQNYCPNCKCGKIFFLKNTFRLRVEFTKSFFTGDYVIGRCISNHRLNGRL